MVILLEKDFNDYSTTKVLTTLKSSGEVIFYQKLDNFKQEINEKEDIFIVGHRPCDYKYRANKFRDIAMEVLVILPEKWKGKIVILTCNDTVAKQEEFIVKKLYSELKGIGIRKFTNPKFLLLKNILF